MDLDPDRYSGMDKQEIIRDLVGHVTASEEEQEEKDHRSGQNTDLNLYLLDNKGFSIGSVDDHINEISESPRASQHAKNFVADHGISEEIIGDEISIIKVFVSEKSRTDESVWISQGEYVWVLTTERQEWRKSIEKLIKYLPQVERLFLSAEDLDDLTEDIRDSSVSGFTAEYHAPYAERRATLRFHGGERKDIDKAKKYFDAKPTRIEFDQTNSPAAAIQAASTNEGRLSWQSVREDSLDKAVDTLQSVSEGYQDRDEQNFEISLSVGIESFDRGFRIDGFTAIELTEPDRSDTTNETLLEELKQDILNSNHYKFGSRTRDTLRVFDSQHDEIFDIAVESPNIVIYPRESTTRHSIRSVVQDIFEWDSTYSLEKVSNSVSVH